MPRMDKLLNLTPRIRRDIFKLDTKPNRQLRLA